MPIAALGGALEVRVEVSGSNVVAMPSFVGSYWSRARDMLAAAFGAHLLQLPGFGGLAAPRVARRGARTGVAVPAPRRPQ